MPLIERDLLRPSAAEQRRTHKRKRLVPAPNSLFVDVRCSSCGNICTVFSHARTVVVCGKCRQVLCTPTGGKARFTEGVAIRPKSL
eukprot:m51a1_g5357 putative 40S ribosomal protein S27e (86) ;mRNA; r:486837-487318